MKHKSLMFIAAGLMTAGTTALAQNTVNSAPIAPTETITVVAPYLINEKPVTAANPTAKPHVKLMDVSLLGAANYADLDLSKDKDAATLKTRIQDVAKSLCKRLADQYPPTVYIPVTNQNCVKVAADDALETAEILTFYYQHQHS